MSSVTANQRKLKYVATINDETLGEDTDPDFEIQYVDISNVDSSGSIVETIAYRFEDAPSRARRRIRDGDVIISTVRTYLQAITQVQSPPESMIASTGFAVVRPQPEFYANYFKYALREPGFLAEVEKRSVGVSYPAINTSDLADIPVHVRPQQRAIADFLDRETARLDKLVAEKERLLNLLAEKRLAIITRTVTRGLDPNVPLRDSGIPWLGKIPAHWEVKRLTHVGRAIIGLTFDPGDTVTDGSGVLVLRATNVYAEKIVLDDNLYVLMDIPDTLRTKLGDILICSRSGSQELIGKNALIDEAAVGQTFGAFMTVFRSPYNEYIFYIFNSPLFDYQAGAFSTSTINQLTVETLNGMEIPLPPTSEQSAIVASLRERMCQIDRLVEATNRTIALLKERRSAVIAAAVTGQLEESRYDENR